MGKVRYWLSPSLWFRSGESPDAQSSPVPVSTPYQVQSPDPAPGTSYQALQSQMPGVTPYQVQNEMRFPRPQKSEALASENVTVNDEIGMSRGTDPAKSTHRPFRKLLTPFAARIGSPSSSKFPSSQKGKLPAHPLNNVQSKPHSSSEQDAGQSTDESDVSWVAEADDEDERSHVDFKKGNISNSSDESWVAEDDEPGPSNGPLEDRPISRPVSISLAKKELSLLAETGSPSTPSGYVVGEGRLGVAEQSSFLLTPGAEMTVQHVANPVYADRSPEVAFAESTSNAVTQMEASRPMVTPALSGHRTSTPIIHSTTTTATHPPTHPPTATTLDRRQEVVSGRLGSW